MKSSIDNKCPRAASHLKTKAKKNALMEERFVQIEVSRTDYMKCDKKNVSPQTNTDKSSPTILLPLD